jgi:DNA-binding response OmpR family regulator
MTKSVLIVEDERDIARIVAAVSRDEGWQAAIAANGEDALEWLRDHGADLLVLDLHLPGALDGLDLYEQIRRERGHSPVTIILSAAVEAPRIAETLGVALVRKPFDVDDLLAVMRKALVA